jgi:hypothetical protein
MIGLFCFVLAVLASPFKSKLRLEAENAVLRHQLIILRRRLRGRVGLTNHDRWFFIQLYRWFPAILRVLTIMRPETFVRWHRAGFRRYWRWKSRRRGGRLPVETELRALIRRMSIENPLWGAPRSLCISQRCRYQNRPWRHRIANVEHHARRTPRAEHHVSVLDRPDRAGGGSDRCQAGRRGTRDCRSRDRTVRAGLADAGVATIERRALANAECVCRRGSGKEPVPTGGWERRTGKKCCLESCVLQRASRACYVFRSIRPMRSPTSGLYTIASRRGSVPATLSRRNN